MNSLLELLLNKQDYSLVNVFIKEPLTNIHKHKYASFDHYIGLNLCLFVFVNVSLICIINSYIYIRRLLTCIYRWAEKFVG